MTACTASVSALATAEAAGPDTVSDGVRLSEPRRPCFGARGALKTPSFRSTACISSRSRKGRGRCASAWHRRGSAQRAAGAVLRLRRGVVPDAPSLASPVRGTAPCLDRPACPYFVALVGAECDTGRPGGRDRYGSRWHPTTHQYPAILPQNAQQRITLG